MIDIEDYYKDIQDNWWEANNPEADWDKLYSSFPDVNWDDFYSKLPKELLPKDTI